MSCEAYNKMFAFFSKRPSAMGWCVAHNAQFDLGTWQINDKKCVWEGNVSPSDNIAQMNWFCSMNAARKIDPKNYSLRYLVDQYETEGVENPCPHSALGDTIATTLILPYFLAAKIIK